MTRRQLRLIETESKIKVATPAYRPNPANNALFIASVFIFAGAFFFFGEILWRALTGG